jgi:hypothetical protein
MFQGWRQGALRAAAEPTNNSLIVFAALLKSRIHAKNAKKWN